MSLMTAKEILEKYWGYTSFREKQEAIIDSVLNKKDTLALLPTGGGKSICFQIPALLQEGICIVVSPLVALMQDQLDGLTSRNIKALAVHSGMSRREIDICLDNAAYGDYKFLYVSPERIQTEMFQERLKKMKVSFVAVDEAHCISQWGYDFRPAYLKIASLRKTFPELTFLALTATATPKVVEDIQEKLLFRESKVIQKSFYRKNLAYVVQYEEDQFAKMLKVIRGVQGSGIIYVNSRRKTVDVANFLLERGVSADFYHAGLGYEVRKQKQNNWINDKRRLIVATNAFGMGIDKSNVRFVIHLDLPESLEAYFQEAGRGGRDEQKAFAVVIATPKLSYELRKRIATSFPELDHIKETYKAVCNFFQLPIGSGLEESFTLDLGVFIERNKFDLLPTYSAIKLLEKEGYWSVDQNGIPFSQLQILVGKAKFNELFVQNSGNENFVQILLRSYGGLFDSMVKIQENKLAKRLDVEKSEVVKILEELHANEVVNYSKAANSPRITFLVDRVDQKALTISAENYTKRKQIASERLEAVINYVESKRECRSKILLTYFGEINNDDCGVCDFCIQKNSDKVSDKQIDEIESELLLFIKRKPVSYKLIQKRFPKLSSAKLDDLLNFLLNEEIIEETNGTYKSK